MSYFATIDGRPVADVATNSGWRDFCVWAGESDGDELHHLIAYGWSNDLVTLRTQLITVLEDNEPSADQLSIGKGLLSVLATRGEVLVISDGIGEGESSES